MIPFQTSHTRTDIFWENKKAIQKSADFNVIINHLRTDIPVQRKKPFLHLHPTSHKRGCFAPPDLPVGAPENHNPSSSSLYYQKLALLSLSILS